jgi:hypothetical protein
VRSRRSPDARRRTWFDTIDEMQTGFDTYLVD